MHLRRFGIIIALLVISAGLACAETNPVVINAGDVPPAISEKAAANGDQISLDNYKGKVVLIDFWATWCGPYDQELPNVMAAYGKYKSQGFEVIGINLDRDRSKFDEFVKEKNVTWPQIFDEQMKIAKAYGVKALPFNFIIGKEGKIAAVGVRGADLSPAIEAVLKGKTPKLGIEIGDPAPAFSEKAVNGEQISLENYKGKVVVLNFWIAQHEGSVKEAKNIAAVSSKFKDKDLVVIGVDLDQKQETLDKILADNRDIDWPQILAADNKFNIVKQYKLKTLPHTFVIGKDGRVLSINPMGESLEKAIENAFKGEATRIIVVPAPAPTPTPAPAARPETGPKVGEVPLAINEKGLDGKDISLDNYKGKVVLIDFWATWCGPCIGELPNVMAAYEKYKSQGFEIIGISLDNDKAKLEAFIKEKNMAWPQFFDGLGWNNKVSTAYGVKSIPATYLIGKDGKIAAKNIRGADLAPAIEKALAE